MRHYHSYDNRRGNTYGVGMKSGCSAHTRGWNAGVRVTIGNDSDDRDQVSVFMTSGSSGGGGDTYLGTVRDTPDGPRWDPAGEAPPAVPRKPAGPTEEDHGLARHALRLAIDTLLLMDCTFGMCPGHDVPFEDMMTCSRCAAVQDLRAELARLDKVIATVPSASNDMN